MGDLGSQESKGNIRIIGIIEIIWNIGKIFQVDNLGTKGNIVEMGRIGSMRKSVYISIYRKTTKIRKIF